MLVAERKPMGLFNFLRGADINEGVAEFRETPDAVLLDVRTPSEFAGGHIPGAVNVPLQELDRVAAVVPDGSTPVFAYCRSGARSAQAAAMLEQAGYKNVRNIGGISSYRGEVER